MNPREAKLAAKRRQMAHFVMRQTGALLDDDPIVHDDRIVLSGQQAECERVATYMRAQLGVEGITVDPIDRELGAWTCVRVPIAELEGALSRMLSDARRELAERRASK